MAEGMLCWRRANRIKAASKAGWIYNYISPYYRVEIIGFRRGRERDAVIRLYLVRKRRIVSERTTRASVPGKHIRNLMTYYYISGYDDRERRIALQISSRRSSRNEAERGTFDRADAAPFPSGKRRNAFTLSTSFYVLHLVSRHRRRIYNVFVARYFCRHF